jgi:Holliday junction resolvase RusA-like endonuclease
MTKTRLTLAALPPSVNAIWRHTKGGKTYRTAAYMTWIRGEEWNVTPQLRGQQRFVGPVYVTVAMRRPRANSDIDNRIKAILDFLQHIGAIDNDKHVYGINAFWSANLRAGTAAEISIVQADELGVAA